MTISQAEQAMVDALNADRTAAGLVPVQVDSRLMSIARARSVDMATKHYFSHTQPDGRNVFDILTAAQHHVVQRRRDHRLEQLPDARAVGRERQLASG